MRPARGIPQPFHQPSIKQAQSAKRPVAPPVYRPEAKKISAPNAFTVQRKTPTAPPVYRPQQTSQAKMATKTFGQPRTAAQMKPKTTAPTQLQRPMAPARPNKQPIAKSIGPRSTVVQAMWDRWFGKAPEKEQKKEGKSSYSDQSLRGKLEFLGYKLDPENRTHRIRGARITIDNGILNQECDEVFDQILTLLSRKSFMVFRAVPRYHPNFADAMRGRATPLGTGEADFDTGSAAWTAWQWRFAMARPLAVSKRGMGKNDKIERVAGYTLEDEYEVGVILETFVTPETEVCFFNSTELQIKGVVNGRVHEVISMGSPLANIGLGHYATKPGAKVSDIMPKPPHEWYQRQRATLVGYNMIEPGGRVKPAHDHSDSYIG